MTGRGREWRWGDAVTSSACSGPWRITFDTNPDDCNLHCIMCEDHWPYSTTQPLSERSEFHIRLPVLCLEYR